MTFYGKVSSNQSCDGLPQEQYMRSWLCYNGKCTRL